MGAVPGKPPLAMPPDLTPREIQVLQALAHGRNTAELHIAPLTVRTHRRNLLRRLGAHTTAAALWVYLSTETLRVRQSRG
jgi:DNA-binding NarL/FixJ family response regulator